MLTALLLTQLAYGATPTEVGALIGAYNQHAILKIPVLDDKQTADLLDGDVVRILFQAEDPEAPSAAVAFALSPIPRNALWIAAQDPHTQVDPGLSEQILKSLGPDHAIWYGYWDLPRPVRDRQWVVESQNTHALARAMDNRGWEHTWILVEDGLDQARPVIARGEVPGITSEHIETAIFTPVNKGSWFMFELEDGQTMFGYQATTVVGGAIPTWLVTKLVMSRLETIVRDLEKRAREWSPTHYSGDHPPVLGADGAPVPLF
jgi:hypothetical protein